MIPPKYTVILVHGMWGNSHQFVYLKACLQALGYIVIAVDLHGESFEDHQEQLRRLVRLNHQGCILIGHSLGGLIVQRVANLEPQSVKGVVLINSAAPKGVSALSLKLLLTMLSPRYVWAMVSGGSYHIHPRDAEELMMNHMETGSDPRKLFPRKETGGTTLRLAFSLIAVEPITQPVLVISGLNDRMTPPKTQNRFTETAKASVSFRHVWYRSGHLSMLEEGIREIFLEDVKRFLFKHGSKKIYRGRKSPTLSIMLGR